MRALPQPPPIFAQKKRRILEQLSIPDSEYTDASPKGSVDAAIRDLIDEINALEGFVTTSSCAGRVSVFLEGRKAGDRPVEGDAEPRDDARAATVAGVGGKGGGGNWLFVSHDPVPGGRAEGDLGELLGLKRARSFDNGVEKGGEAKAAARLIHFKFEPMILHVLTASLEHAQLLLKCGLQAGFRESGALNLLAPSEEAVTPMVAVRSMGLALESLIGVQKGDVVQSTVSPDYLQTLVEISNERFVENSKRIQRFRAAILEVTQPLKKKDGTEWEDAQARRERKRAEGLRKKAELSAKEHQEQELQTDQDLDLNLNADFT